MMDGGTQRQMTWQELCDEMVRQRKRAESAERRAERERRHRKWALEKMRYLLGRKKWWAALATELDEETACLRLQRTEREIELRTVRSRAALEAELKHLDSHAGELTSRLASCLTDLAHREAEVARLRELGQALRESTKNCERMGVHSGRECAEWDRALSPQAGREEEGRETNA